MCHRLSLPCGPVAPRQLYHHVTPRYPFLSDALLSGLQRGMGILSIPISLSRCENSDERQHRIGVKGYYYGFWKTQPVTHSQQQLLCYCVTSSPTSLPLGLQGVITKYIASLLITCTCDMVIDQNFSTISARELFLIPHQNYFYKM